MSLRPFAPGAHTPHTPDHTLICIPEAFTQTETRLLGIAIPTRIPGRRQPIVENHVLLLAFAAT